MASQNKGLLWRAHLVSGASIGVYTVGLDTPLRLVINLDFCRCVLEQCQCVFQTREARVLFCREAVLGAMPLATRARSHAGCTHHGRYQVQ